MARKRGNPEYIGDFSYWPKWEARIDPAAAKANLEPMLEEGLNPESCWSGQHWQVSQLIRGIAAVGDLPEAIALLPRFKGDDYTLLTMEAIGRDRLAVGDDEGFQTAIDTLCLLEVKNSDYTVPGEARAAALLLEAGRREDGLAIMTALIKKTRGTRKFDTLCKAFCAAGALPEAGKKISNRSSRDRALKPVILAYGAADDLAGALKVMAEIQEVRVRGFAGTAVITSWAARHNLYRYTPIH